MEEIWVADEVGPTPRQGVAEDALAQRGASVTPAPKKSEARPIAIWTRPASRGVEQLLGHGRSGPALDGRGHEREVLGHRCAIGRAVAVEVLQADQQRAVSFGRGQHATLERREELGPFRVRGVQALVDDGGATWLPRWPLQDHWRPPLASRLLRQRRGSASRHHPDRVAQARQARGQCPAHIAGPEHDVQRTISHDRQPVPSMQRLNGRRLAG